MNADEIYRKPEVSKRYSQYLKTKKPNQNCVFCDKNEMNIRNVGGKLKFFTLVESSAPYAYWDVKEVISNLMIVPIRHICCLSDMNEGESQEYLSLVKKYSKLGYDVFVRNSGSVGKSINHLHTHLLKTVELRLGVKVEYFKNDESES